MIAAIAVLCVSAPAQKEMLTKEETINYLNKKLQEIDGRDLLQPDKTPYRYSNVHFRIVKDKDTVELRVTGTYHGAHAGCEMVWIFNPGHISGIVPQSGATESSPVKHLLIQFPSKTVRYSSCQVPAWTDYDYASFLYFAAVPENALKIKRALLHLRDLYKAEDDPFGN